MEEYFEEPIRRLAEGISSSYSQVRDTLRRRYDGYHFLKSNIGVYNPLSLCCALDASEFNNYWYESGTPYFLVELLQQNDWQLSDLQNPKIDASLLGVKDFRNPIPFFFQSGYLTIKKYDEEYQTHELGYPNEEVEQSFVNFLLPYYLSTKEYENTFFVGNFIDDVKTGRVEDFIRRISILFDDADYRMAGKMEKYFQNALYIIFKIMNFHVEVERSTSRGRMDILIKTERYIYIIECKLDGSVDEVLQQIDEKGYAAPFAADSRKIYKVALCFSSQTRSVSEWKVAE